MKIHSKDYRVRPGKKVDLGDWPTVGDPMCGSREQYRERLEEHVRKLAALQQLHYASARSAVLVVFQGMDAAGKDGAIRHVMSGINPQGCQVFSFKRPSEEELDHDFLWRTTRNLPARGRIGIFNRSYYEEVLVVRVHPEILRAEALPDGRPGEEGVWKGRYRSITDLEDHLHRNGTQILKFFLHLSRDEQRRRLVDRIDDPGKNWKFNDADVLERGHWKEYQKAYEACLGSTSTQSAPWYIVPADRKGDARLIVSHILLETFKDLKMSYPHVGGKRRRELAETRKRLLGGKVSR